VSDLLGRSCIASVLEKEVVSCLLKGKFPERRGNVTEKHLVGRKWNMKNTVTVEFKSHGTLEKETATYSSVFAW